MLKFTHRLFLIVAAGFLLLACSALNLNAQEQPPGGPVRRPTPAPTPAPTPQPTPGKRGRVSEGQVQEQSDKTLERTQRVSEISDKDRAREFDRTTAQPPNSIRVQVRYKKEYGYKGDTNAFGYVGPTSCDAFSVSITPDPSVRLEYLIGIQNPDKMQESNGFYVCDFLVTDLPLNAPIKVGVDLADHRSLPFEAWKVGSQAQPPPGQQRTIIIVGGRASRQRRAQDGTVMLTEAQPRTTQVFEMVYAPPPLTPPKLPALQRGRLPVTPR